MRRAPPYRRTPSAAIEPEPGQSHQSGAPAHQANGIGDWSPASGPATRVRAPAALRTQTSLWIGRPHAPMHNARPIASEPSPFQATVVAPQPSRRIVRRPAGDQVATPPRVVT